MVVATAVVLTLGVGLSTPAQAAVRIIHDPRGDAPYDRFDMIRVRFNNGDHRLSVHVKASAELSPGIGYLVFHFSPSHDFDYYFEATSRRAAHGRVGNRLTLYSAGHTTRYPNCRVKARWAFAAHSVTISLPRSCVSDEISGPLWMTASLGHRQPMTQDFIPYDRWPRVRQG